MFEAELISPAARWGIERAWRISYLIPSHLSLEVTHTPTTHIPLERTSHVKRELGKHGSWLGSLFPATTLHCAMWNTNVWSSANHLFHSTSLPSELLSNSLGWHSKPTPGTSLVTQWLRICLPMQGTQVRSPGPGRSHMPRSN